MKRSIAVVIAALVIVGAGRAVAQETTPGPGSIEITLIPGGATFYTSTDTAPEFGNYTLGAGVTYAINRIVGVEGEVAGTVGISQDLAFGGSTMNRKSPDTPSFARPQRHRDVSDGQRRRRGQVVCLERPVGTARRLPIHGGAQQG